MISNKKNRFHSKFIIMGLAQIKKPKNIIPFNLSLQDRYNKTMNIKEWYILKSIIPHFFSLLFVKLCQNFGLFVINLSTLHLLKLY